MAEMLTVVCDPCSMIEGLSTPAAQRVTIRVGDGTIRNLSQDLCEDHLEGLIEMSRPAKRGRPPAMSGRKSTKTE